MADELKSAWEIALEKLKARDEAPESLTEEQKEEIAEIRRRCQAKLAEKEIDCQSRIRKAVGEGDFDKVQAIRDELVQARRRLEEDMEKKVRLARAESTSG